LKIHAHETWIYRTRGHAGTVLAGAKQLPAQPALQLLKAGKARVIVLIEAPEDS
jgi:hypothetical protein